MKLRVKSSFGFDDIHKFNSCFWCYRSWWLFDSDIIGSYLQLLLFIYITIKLENFKL